MKFKNHQRKISWKLAIFLTIVILVLMAHMRQEGFKTILHDVAAAEKNKQSKPYQRLTIQYTWTLGGFGNILLLKNLTIFNPTTIAMKDAVIQCSVFGASGTHLGDATITIYQAIMPKSESYSEEVNMGFVNSQAAKAGCIVIRAVTP